MAMTFEHVAKEAPSVIRDLFENHVTKHFRVIAPTVLHVNVNLRCNTTCAMCNIWELKSPHTLSLEQFESIFADPVYRKVEYIVLAGGEPTLRNDLAEIVALLHKHMPTQKTDDTFEHHQSAQHSETVSSDCRLLRTAPNSSDDGCLP